MAVGKDTLPELFPVAGFRLGVTSAGIKTPNRLDLVVMELCDSATTAAVFTQNAFCAAPVQIAKQHIAQMSPKYLLVNTGNANAGTGEQGLKNSRHSCAQLSELTGVALEEVLPFSTGVIGEQLPIEKIIDALPAAIKTLSDGNWEKAAQGIMTTDTRPKAASRQLSFQGKTLTITGIAKGAGMIKPNMATMLAYVATDAGLSDGLLNNVLQQAVNQSFNRITVDGDTSTNDACVLVATGKSGVEIKSEDSHYQLLVDAITDVFIELAQGLVRDGEGASKFVTVQIAGGASEQECLQVAYTIAESPLVKTALFASDPNWGRLLAAIGRAGIDNLEVDLVSVHLNDVLIAEKGCRADGYTEEQGVMAMEQEDIVICVNLNRGDQQATVWTSDLSHEYVRVNAEYRT